MALSDISITRPVFAGVLSMLLIAFGLVSFTKLSLREYPDIDPPVVSVTTNYVGASASVVETRITQLIEDRISGVEGIRTISSSSTDGRSTVTVEFDISRDIEAAANDIRDKTSSVLGNLPEEADPPDIRKADSSDEVILWISLTSERMDILQLTDYAKRYLQDRFSVLPGVSQVRIGGGLEYSMRVWLNRQEMAARGITAGDVETALRSENVELPAGSIESLNTQFTARIQRGYATPEDFDKLVVKRGDNGYLVRLGDIARIEKAAIESRTLFRGNGVPMVGIGIIKQAKANTIAVAEEAKKLAESLAPTLPSGMKLIKTYDSSVFISEAIHEVYNTLFIAIGLVIGIIFLFLGSARAVLIPAVTVPVSVIATFIALYVFGFSINLLTLLALVLAIGLVVDDAIVVLENVYRRIEEGEPPLLAAYEGTRQVRFAVIATSIVLVAVFVPITFLEGNLGRLFTEFGITMAAAILFSMFAALSLCPMLASKILKRNENSNGFAANVERFFERFNHGYMKVLKVLLRARYLVLVAFLGLAGMSWFLFTALPSEYAPREDRGVFNIMVNAPEGASFSYTKEYIEEIERRLQPYIDSGEATRIIARAPRSFGTLASFNDGMIIMVLSEWGHRRPAQAIMGEISAKLADLPGVRAFPVMRQGFGGGASKPVQFVIGGGTYEQLAQWRNTLLQKIAEDNPGLTDIDSDYKETKPQLRITVDRDRAADLGVSVSEIGNTLQTMLGSKQVTTYIEEGEEYDVILEGERDEQRTPSDIGNIYVHSTKQDALVPLSSVVKISEYADSGTLNRYNRIRAITIEAGLGPDLALGDALQYLEKLARDNLPDTAMIDYKGQSLDFKKGGSSILFVFLLGFAVVYLVLAAQFESFIHPLVIILTVPLAISGALAGLYLTGNSLNIYTQIGLIMLVGLAAKNGILIVEFANQLRDEGMEFREALLEASAKRLRPILMTGLTAVMGALPLILTSGAGSETRVAIGVVVLFGVLAATVFTVFIVPVAYDLMCRGTGSPGDVERALNKEIQDHSKQDNTV